MNIQVDCSKKPGRIDLTGDLTIYHAAEIKDTLLASINDNDEIEMNLSGVIEIDTAGIQLLMLAKRHANAADKKLSLVAHNPVVVSMIELYNLATFFGDPLVIPAKKGAKR